MQKISWWKLILSIAFTILSVLCVMPNFVANPSIALSEPINLGLDLRGGSQLLLNVDSERYIQDVQEANVESLKNNLRKQKIAYKNLRLHGSSITFMLRDAQDAKKIQDLVYNIDAYLSQSVNGDEVTVYYNEYALNQLQDKVIDQSIEVIRMRIDSTGTKEPSIQRQGVSNIMLQLPGAQDPGELKRLLGQTAKLTLHLVDEIATNNYNPAVKLPANLMAVQDGEMTLILEKKIVISGDHLNNAQVQIDQNGAAVVAFSLKQVGAQRFGEATSNNRGKLLAIVLDNKILSAPRINEPIMGGEGRISGNFTLESANELALMLRAGALPAPLKIIEERSIGPNLGADSIESGKMAAIGAFCLVAVFMLLAYGVLGLFANITLVIALLYIFAMLCASNATLTLPGIAGIILTIGMAVDANVLIYERIKEEVVKGSSNLYAVKMGFESAFATILDANVTTLIAAFLLYSFGVGAIKGFAVTLSIGIIASMYTALVITKLLIDIWLRYAKPKSLGLL
jgi:preprotein translocase subunit SecD